MKNCKIVSCGKKTAVMALAVSVGAMLMTGCSTSASASGSTASAGKPVVTVWAGGSDNVRVQFEKQIQQFNASQDQYTAELQFITSGTGAQGLFERVVAAKKGGPDGYGLRCDRAGRRRGDEIRGRRRRGFLCSPG